jgi:hypothetical protein
MLSRAVTKGGRFGCERFLLFYLAGSFISPVCPIEKWVI